MQKIMHQIADARLNTSTTVEGGESDIREIGETMAVIQETVLKILKDFRKLRPTQLDMEINDFHHTRIDHDSQIKLSILEAKMDSMKELFQELPFNITKSNHSPNSVTADTLRILRSKFDEIKNPAFGTGGEIDAVRHQITQHVNHYYREIQDEQYDHSLLSPLKEIQILSILIISVFLKKQILAFEQ